MERWNFAPLRYALAIVRFPPLLDMQPYVGAFQERIRRSYANMEEHVSQGLRANVGAEGVHFEAVLEKMWQFVDVKRSHAVMLGSDFLLVHAGVHYDNHTDFFDRMKAAIIALQDTPGLDITHANAIGFRVIDLIEPRPRTAERVGQYIRPWALPTAGADVGDPAIELREGAYIASFTTSLGALRFQALRRPSGAFPPDLATPFVRSNGWIPKVEAKDFVLLDIDHFVSFETPKALDAGELRATFEGMHGVSRKVFEAAVTPFALKIWGRKK